jgi:hypothetical protein
VSIRRQFRLTHYLSSALGAGNAVWHLAFLNHDTHGSF